MIYFKMYTWGELGSNHAEIILKQKFGVIYFIITPTIFYKYFFIFHEIMRYTHPQHHVIKKEFNKKDSI